MNDKFQDAEDINPNPVAPGKQLQMQDGINMLPMAPGASLETVVKNAEKYFAVQDTIRKLAIRVTNVNDWMDQNGEPYLEWTGASKIAGAFGLEYDEPKAVEKILSDDKGQYLECQVWGMVRWQGHGIPETGTASSRDEFFGVRTVKGPDGKPVYENGKVKKYFLPLSEINLGDIRKKALTNFLNRGIKTRLGLSFTWEEITEATGGRITREKCGAVDYKKGGGGGYTPRPQAAPPTAAPHPQGDPGPQEPPQGHPAQPAAQQPQGQPPANEDADVALKKANLRDWILEMCESEAAAGKYLEELTTFQGQDNNGQPMQVPGKKNVSKLTNKQVYRLYPIIEGYYRDYQEKRRPAKPGLAPEDSLPF